MWLGSRSKKATKESGREREAGEEEEEVKHALALCCLAYSIPMPPSIFFRVALVSSAHPLLAIAPVFYR